MASENKPIKRSVQLTPLSKDHHEGLLLVWKIRQGIKLGVENERIALYVKWFWENDLEEHFREEEEIFIPYFEKNALIGRMIEDHRAIKDLIFGKDLEKQQTLEDLATALNDHIRFEERELFPYVETSLSPSDLNSIGTRLHKEKRECAKWQDEFWLKK